jgi:adenylate cyclase
VIDTRDLESWLATTARVALSPEETVAGLIEWFAAERIPVWRLRLGQSIPNPLVSAWDIVWTRGEGPPRLREVRRQLLSTGAWAGSPFQFVVQNRRSFRRRLDELDPQDHAVLYEIRNAGGTDYLALPLNYGNGVTQAVSLVSDAAEGFSAEHVTTLERLFPFVGAALEPHAMRRATTSLLATYIGRGPAAEVEAGAILRGARRTINAAILFADLRSFTATSASVGEEELLALLNDFFECVVDEVQANGGEVLKFIGDAVLAVFPVDAFGDPAGACLAAEKSVEEALRTFAVKRPASAFVAALHLGPVSYGNIGSASRLDFTVVGPATNLTSRLEQVAKESGHVAVCSAEFARHRPGQWTKVADKQLRGFDDPVGIYALNAHQAKRSG